MRFCVCLAPLKSELPRLNMSIIGSRVTEKEVPVKGTLTFGSEEGGMLTH